MPENVYLHMASWVAPAGIAFDTTALNTLYNNAAAVFALDNDKKPIYPAEDISTAEILKIEFNGKGDRKYAVLHRFDESLPSAGQSTIVFFSPYFDSSSKAMIVLQFDDNGNYLGINKVAIDSGLKNIGTGTNSVIVTGSASSSADYAVALGNNAKASTMFSIALGNNVLASGSASTALGCSAEASGDNSTALGYNAGASGNEATALGNNVLASGDNSTALGRSAAAFADHSIALGCYARAYIDNSISFDTISPSSEDRDKTLILRDPSHLFFRNADNSDSITEYSGYSGGKTLQDYLDETTAGIDAAIPTDITGDAGANTISLYHDGTAISGQTPLQLKTINGQSIIGTGDITIPAAASLMAAKSAPMSSYATKYVSGVSATKSQVFVVDTQIAGEGIRILSVDIPTQTDVFFGAPYYADGTWKVKAINYGDDFTNAKVEIMYAN